EQGSVWLGTPATVRPAIVKGQRQEILDVWPRAGLRCRAVDASSSGLSRLPGEGTPGQVSAAGGGVSPDRRFVASACLDRKPDVRDVQEMMSRMKSNDSGENFHAALDAGLRRRS